MSGSYETPAGRAATRLRTVLAVSAGIVAAASPGQSAPVAQQPLLHQRHLTYLGAFALPQNQVGESFFNYGGRALTPWFDPGIGAETLLMEGHAWYPGNVAQVRIPPTVVKSGDWRDLPMATVVQGFQDVTDGKMDTAANYTAFVYGMLPYNGRLILTVSEYYDADGSQVNTHAVSTFNLALTNDLQGFFPINALASPRSLGGYMTLIPPQWRPWLGGPALTSQCCLAIIGNSSCGPAATVFDPDDVGRETPIPGTTVLYYPLAHPLAQPDTQNLLYNLATQIVGVAFPEGSRSVLFFGRHGTGPYCYGTGAECGDPADDSKGTHAYPYQHQVWAYDANDLVAVRNGERLPWELRPYATWRLDELDASGDAKMVSAGYDPGRGRLYVAQSYGDFPRIEVYQISVPAPLLLSAELHHGSQLRLRVNGGPNVDCAIESSGDLAHWTNLVSGRTDGAGFLEHYEPVSTDSAQWFFRASSPN